MQKFKPRHNKPEEKIRNAIIEMLRSKRWYVKIMHGSLYQSGFPDLFACHKIIGIRLIEVKLPEMKGSRFTKAQKKEFNDIILSGGDIWILTAATDSEYKKLFVPANASTIMLDHM